MYVSADHHSKKPNKMPILDTCTNKHTITTQDWCLLPLTTMTVISKWLLSQMLKCTSDKHIISFHRHSINFIYMYLIIAENKLNK